MRNRKGFVLLLSLWFCTLQVQSLRVSPKEAFKKSVMAFSTEVVHRSVNPWESLEDFYQVNSTGGEEVVTERGAFIARVGYTTMRFVKSTEGEASSITMTLLPTHCDNGTNAVVTLTHQYGDAYNWPRFKGHLDWNMAVSKAIKSQYQDDATVWDLGTGAGWMSVLLKVKQRRLNVVATDVNRPSLRLAELNADMNQVDIDLRLGDLFSPFSMDEGADIIFFSPPQIPSDSKPAAAEISSAERDALYVKGDGRWLFRRFFDEVSGYLNPGGRIFMGVDNNHEEFVRALIKGGFRVTSKLVSTAPGMLLGMERDHQLEQQRPPEQVDDAIHSGHEL